MDRGSAFWHAVVLTLLGHAAVLGWMAGRPPEPAPHGARSGVPLTFHTRAIRPPATPPAPPPPAAQPEPVAAPPAPTPAAPREPARREAAPAPVPPPQAAASSPSPSTPTAKDAPYLPRGELTALPRVQGPVDVPFPEELTGVVDLKVRLTLFIDERGSVQHIRIDTADVHPSFQRVIREAFGAAKFSPGEVDGVAVRSQMRMEVEFQSPGGRR